MKTLIQLAVVAVIVGGLSAVGTFYYQQRVTPVAAATDQKPATAESTAKDPTDEDHSTDSEADHQKPAEVAGETVKAAEPIENELAAAEPRKSLQPPAANPQHNDKPNPGEPSSEAVDHQLEAPVAVRPPYAPEGDEAGALINILRERSRVATENEKRLAQRQDAMQLIFDDLRSEQARTLKIRQRLAHELKESQQAIDAALQGIENDRTAMQRDQAEAKKASEEAVRAAIQERDQLRKQLSQAAQPKTESQSATEPADSPEDNANLKKMAGVFDSMPAENVAKVFEQLVKNKKIAAVVSLLNAMKERPAAKVLGVIAESNPDLAANLTDRLKRLKAPTPVPSAE